MKGVILMDFDFTSQEIIFIFGHFKKKTKELRLLKDSPNCPISHENITQDIKLYSSITDKIEKCYPQLNELNTFL
jgi:hypothetical protein